MSFEACQTCKLTGNSLCVCTAAALRGFTVPPTLAAGWRRDGIFCKAGEMACPQFCRARVLSLVSHPWAFFSFLALECQRESGCFEGEVPAESRVTRQPWAITINWNNFHLPCNCNDSQLVSWFKFRGFPLSLFLPSAFPTRSSCPSLSQSLSGLALCLPEKVPPYCAALWKAMALLRALLLRLWLQPGCCGVAHSFPCGWQDPGCLLSLHPFRAKRGVWVCFPESSLCLMFAQCQKGCGL